MCLIAFSLGQSARFPLVVAANRDEFFRRPTAPLDWWTTEAGNRVLSGRDLKSGGTWLAVSPEGSVSAVTNVREGSPEAGHISRGELPLRALAEPEVQLQESLSATSTRYAGFNLVRLGNTEGWCSDQNSGWYSGWYYSNRDAHPGRSIYRGVYGLSNHLLQTPWPKLLRLREAVGHTVKSAREDAEMLHKDLTGLLQDTTPAPDHLLPNTGVHRDTERFLSSPFITGTEYGTRATTIVSVSNSGEIYVTEQSWAPEGQPEEYREFHWQR
ncbi:MULTISPECIES: NRDE family protein [unclassified Marinobacter]|uniref:NRDE family protein n=1 Tax=unclassified Marinobacter TaxID=83889 RepID=UPI0019045914|nr:NRDE family protein [Marinobacter sp. 1-4A]MBK1853172.1 NRDE family protein [Marinobacter sp. 1-4A]